MEETQVNSKESSILHIPMEWMNEYFCISYEALQPGQTIHPHPHTKYHWHIIINLTPCQGKVWFKTRTLAMLTFYITVPFHIKLYHSQKFLTPMSHNTTSTIGKNVKWNLISTKSCYRFTSSLSASKSLSSRIYWNAYPAHQDNTRLVLPICTETLYPSRH